MSEYKRLTERCGKGVAVKETSTNDNMSIWNAIERLAELEDKIEQGTLIELPCKVGDTVYWCEDKVQGIFEAVVYDYSMSKDKYCLYVKKSNYPIFSRDLGKRWFLTREAAEKRLLELQGEKNNYVGERA